MSGGKEMALKLLLQMQENVSKEMGKVKNALTGVKNEASDTAKELDGAGKSSKTTGERFTEMGGAVKAFIGLAAVGKLASITKELVILGAQADRIHTAFANMQGGAIAASHGLEALRVASQGTIADTDLMLAANRAQLLGVSQSAADLGELMQVAAARGKAMGMTTSQAFNDMVTGIGRQSRMILDNLGIVVDTEQAYADYASAVGKTVEELDDLEKKQAFVNTILQGSEDLLASNADAALDAAGQIEAMGAQWQNVKENLGRTASGGMASMGVGEALGGAADFLGKAADANNALAETRGQLKALREEGVLTRGEYRRLSEQANQLTTNHRYKKQTLEELNQTLEDLHPSLALSEQKEQDLAAASQISASAIRKEAAALREYKAAQEQQAAAVELAYQQKLARQQRATALAGMADQLGPTDDRGNAAGMRAEDEAMYAAQQEKAAAYLEQKKAENMALLMEAQSYMGQLQALTAGHNMAMSNLDMQGQLQAENAEFQHNYRKAQALANYQAERQMLIEQGKLQEAQQLDAKHQAENASNTAAYNNQKQLQKRELLAQKIIQQKAYIAQLKTQIATVKKKLAIMVMEAQLSTTGKINMETGILKILTEGASESTRLEIEKSKAMLETQQQLSEGQIGMAESTVQALLDLYAGDLGAAGEGLAALEAEMAGFGEDILDGVQSTFASGDFGVGASISDGMSSAAEQAEQSSVRAIQDVTSSLEQSISAMKAAMDDLPGIMMTPEMEAGWEEAGKFFKHAVSRLWAWLSEGDVKEHVEKVQQYLAPIKEIFSLGQLDLTWKPVDDFDTISKKFVGQLERGGTALMGWLRKIKSNDVWAEAVVECGELAGHVSKLWGVLTDLTKFKPDARGDMEFLEDARRTVRQLELGGRAIMEWLMKIVANQTWKTAMRQAGPVAEDVKKVMGIFGDVSKIQPSDEPHFARYVQTTIEQMEYAGGVVMSWVGRIAGNDPWRKALEAAVPVVENIKALLGIFDINFTKFRGLNTGFSTLAVKVIDELAKALTGGNGSGGALEILKGVREQFGDEIKLATDMLKDLEAFWKSAEAILDTITNIGTGAGPDMGVARAVMLMIQDMVRTNPTEWSSSIEGLGVSVGQSNTPIVFRHEWSITLSIPQLGALATGTATSQGPAGSVTPVELSMEAGGV